MSRKTFAVALMDAPYESENLTTAFRILGAMAQRGHNINVFAYEGAAGLAFAKQAPHPNPVHGKNLAEENQPTTLLALAKQNGGKVDWVNCGMCVDERGVGEFVAGRRGSPTDFHAFCEASDAVAIYFLDPMIAAGFVARWCAAATIDVADGAFRLRVDAPTPRVGVAAHRTP